MTTPIDPEEPSRQTGSVDDGWRPPTGFDSLSAPVHRASTVVFDSVEQMRSDAWKEDAGYVYGLHGTPTTMLLAHRIAQLEGGRKTLLVPSGLAAISLVNFACLKTGDEVLLPDNVYFPSRDLAARFLARFGVVARFYDPLSGIDSVLSSKTRLVWIESPGSITMEVPDARAIAQAAHAAGAVVALDNTYGAGILLNGFDVGADIVMQAITKYPSGGSDVLMGSVTVNDESLAAALQDAHDRLGYGVTGDDAYLVLRSLPTLKMRLREHGKAAFEVAQWFKGRAGVDRIHHPLLAECPGHSVFIREFDGAGGLFAVVMSSSVSAAELDHRAERLQRFKMGFSWGGAQSLAVPYPTVPRSVSAWTAGPVLRLFVGLEEPVDLIRDLEQAGF